MSDSFWLKTHLLHFRGRSSVILGVHGVRKQELRLALGSVDFNREGNGRADEDTVRSLLGDDQPALFDTELAAQTSWDDDAPALADFAGFHRTSNARQAECRAELV